MLLPAVSLRYRYFSISLQERTTIKFWQELWLSEGREAHRYPSESLFDQFWQLIALSLWTRIWGLVLSTFKGQATKAVKAFYNWDFSMSSGKLMVKSHRFATRLSYSGRLANLEPREKFYVFDLYGFRFVFSIRSDRSSSLGYLAESLWENTTDRQMIELALNRRKAKWLYVWVDA